MLYTDKIIMPYQYLLKLVLYPVLLIGVLKPVGLYAQPQQNNYRSSLHYLQNEEPERSALLEVLEQINTLPTSSDSLVMIEQQIYKNAKKTKDEYYLIIAFDNLATIYANIYGDNEKALELTERQISEYGRIDAPPEQKLAGLSKYMFLLEQTGARDSASVTAVKVEHLLGKISDPVFIAFGYRQLCLFFNSRLDYTKAEAICKEGLEYNKSMNQENYNSSFYSTLALIAEEKGNDIDTVISYIRRSIDAAKSSNEDFFLRTEYRNLADKYARTGEVDSALKYFKLTETYFKKYPWQYGLGISRLMYAEFLVDQGSLDEAYQIADSISRLPDADFNLLLRSYNVLSRYYARQGNFSIMEMFMAKNDSVLRANFNTDIAKAREEVTVKYETRVKEQENELLSIENRSKRVQVIFMTVLALGLLIIAILLVRSRKRQKKLYLQEKNLLRLETERKEKEKSDALDARLQMQQKLRQSIKFTMQQQNKNLELTELIEELKVGSENHFAQKKASQILKKLRDYSNDDLLWEIEEKATSVYPNLVNYLNSVFSARSKTEMLYCIMLVMEYSAADIARTLQRSEKAIRSLRYRVRKKMQLNEEEDLLIHLKSCS